MNNKFNPITKPICKDCNFYEPKGFYTWELEEDLEKRLCKHLKRCQRIYDMATKTKQMQLSDFIGG